MRDRYRVNWENEQENWVNITIPVMGIVTLVTIICFIVWFWNDPFTGREFNTPGASAFVGFWAGCISGIAFGLVSGTACWALVFLYRLCSHYWHQPRPVSAIKASSEPYFRQTRHRLDLIRKAVKDIRDEDALRELQVAEELLNKLERTLK